MYVGAMKVAILGTGKMGSAIARRLSQNGVDVVLWDRTREKAESLGFGTVADTAPAAAVMATIVISSLTGDWAVREVYTAEEGVLAAADRQLFLEMSTTSPELKEELAEKIAATGAHFLDAPVLGSTPAVESGSLVILIGGDPALTDRARPVLELLGESRYVGPAGAAARLKLVANTMLGGISALAAELETAATAVGLRKEDAFWVLARLAPYLQVRERGFLDDQHEPVLFRLTDMVKDLELALGTFRQADAPVPLTVAVTRLFAEANESVGELDLSAIIRHYKRAVA